MPPAAEYHLDGTGLTVGIPTGCFGIDAICQYKIVVDGKDEVVESNEVNNSGAGQCSRVIL